MTSAPSRRRRLSGSEALPGCDVADRGVAGCGVADRGVAGCGVADRGVAGCGVADRGVAGCGVATGSCDEMTQGGVRMVVLERSPLLTLGAWATLGDSWPGRKRSVWQSCHVTPSGRSHKRS